MPARVALFVDRCEVQHIPESVGDLTDSNSILFCVKWVWTQACVALALVLPRSGASSALWLCNKVAGIGGCVAAARGRGTGHCKLLQWPQLRRNSLRFSFRLFMFLSRCGFTARRCQLIPTQLCTLILLQRSQFVKQLMPDGATVHRRHRVNKTITDFL